jgi:hypothetical protein
MGRRIVLVVLLAGATAARAEDRFGTAGQIVPSGAISFNYAMGPDIGTIFISPGVLWFPVNGIAIGGAAFYGYFSRQQGAGFIQPATHQVGLQPELGVALPIGDAFALFPRVGVQFTWVFAQNFGAQRFTALQAVAPVLFFPVPHFFLGFGPYLRVDPDRPSQGQFGLSSEIGGYF